MKTKTDLLAFFEKLHEPTKKYRQQQNGRLNFGTSVTHYSQTRIEAEGFLRLLWGVGPLAGAGVISEADFAYYKDAIVHSVDPEDPAYWGQVESFDQYIVEMAALAVTLIETKQIFWDKLAQNEQQNIYAWLNRVNEVGVHPNNWRFFRILVNVAFLKLGLPYSQEKLAEDKLLLEKFYLKDGWYFDGTPQQMDYYIPWAFHYYGLLYAHYMKEEDPEYAQKYIARAKVFAQSFQYWFAENGSGVPFGRSLIYRFAEGAFWSACVFCDIEVLPWGQIKTLLLNHFDYWSKQSIQKRDGILSIGYCYENFYMAERYNSPGSPYWSFKTFLALAVSEEHPFWQSEAQALTRSEKIMIEPAKMLLTNQAGKNVQLFPSAQASKQAHGGDKYSKLVYSSLFGFSVAKGHEGLEQLAADNCLAVAEAGTENYVSKNFSKETTVTEDFLRHLWEPLPGVVIQTTVVPLGDWHIRIHKVTTARPLVVADSGFSNQTFNGHPKDYQLDKLTEAGICFTSKIGTTASVQFHGYQQVEAIFPEPNTNLLYPNTLFTTIRQTLTEGTHLLVSGHYGSHLPVTAVPKVTVDEGLLRIQKADKNLEILLD